MQHAESFLRDAFPVAECRAQFPALSRRVGDRPAVFFGGPAGSQTPQSVIDAVADYMARCNANRGGAFATSQESDAQLEEAHRAAAMFLGADDPDCVVFGANMTTLNFALSRALARTWRAGDEVIVTRLDHDANVTPWLLAARDAGATVKQVGICPDDCSLDMAALRSLLTPRTRLVAVTCASNAVGTIPPFEEIVRLAHRYGALVVLDAVHFAPHRLIDVTAWDCDFLLSSAYKFFGPHVGLLWGRRMLLEGLEAYKLRPAPAAPPGKWMTGTQNHEGILGVAAAIRYLTSLGGRMAGDTANPRRQLEAAFERIGGYEHALLQQMLDGLAGMRDVHIWGVSDRQLPQCRTPTIAFTHRRLKSLSIARHLANEGIFVWHGNFYAMQLTESLSLEPDGLVRIGLLHYNTPQEVDRLLEVIGQL